MERGRQRLAARVSSEAAGGSVRRPPPTAANIYGSIGGRDARRE